MHGLVERLLEIREAHDEIEASLAETERELAEIEGHHLMLSPPWWARWFLGQKSSLPQARVVKRFAPRTR